MSSKRWAAKSPVGPLRLYPSATSEQSEQSHFLQGTSSVSVLFVGPSKDPFYPCPFGNIPSLSLHWSSPGKQEEAWHRSDIVRDLLTLCPAPPPPPGCCLCHRLGASEDRCRRRATWSVCCSVVKFKAISMRWYWRRLVLSQLRSSADFQRSSTSACEGAGRGRFPAGEHRSGPPSCTPGTALWRPAGGGTLSVKFPSWSALFSCFRMDSL